MSQGTRRVLNFLPADCIQYTVNAILSRGQNGEGARKQL